MIKINNLTKIYGKHKAIDNINLDIKKGDMIGLLGPNGAGKTTAMNIISGYIPATYGDIKIDNYDIISQPDKAKSKIGYLPDTPPLYPNMTVNEYLYFVCEIKKIKKNIRKKAISEIKEKTKIEDIGDRIINNLSKGYRQRVGIAQALINNPEIIILDEPTNGFDIKQIIDMRSVIKELSKIHTIIISSHILSEISNICSKIVIINKGKIVYESKINELDSNNKRIFAKIKANKDIFEKEIKKANLIDNIEIIKSNTEYIEIFAYNYNDCADIRENIFWLCSKNGFPILQMNYIKNELEQIFIEHTA